mmetsp:Transcript_3728/g.9620  ORF Transcript_3728/g.9620 Transcript_3728/m.9620 type:complete len:360 (+) Transcript_3728:37-1116(+)
MTFWQDSYTDPLRWRFKEYGGESRIHGKPRLDEYENEFCKTKVFVMHRPTHDPKLGVKGEYPFSQYLGSRRRLWEIRLQTRFKRIPEHPIYFGLELSQYVPVSMMTRQAQNALVTACRSIVGDCYHSTGDDPARTTGELEPPCFVMPLWAFDQFDVSAPGSEPCLLGDDLDRKGVRRTDGVKTYIEAVENMIASFSCDEVYTFCFWGVSQFLDCINWQVVGGLVPGVHFDFNKLCGSPPVHLSIYELQPSCQNKDSRHVASRKRYYLDVAVWSALHPPASEHQRNVGVNATSGCQEGAPHGSETLDDFISEPISGQQSKPAASPAVQDFDLLGLNAEPEQPNAKAQNSSAKVDVLDLLA